MSYYDQIVKIGQQFYLSNFPLSIKKSNQAILNSTKSATETASKTAESAPAIIPKPIGRSQNRNGELPFDLCVYLDTAGDVSHADGYVQLVIHFTDGTTDSKPAAFYGANEDEEFCYKKDISHLVVSNGGSNGWIGRFQLKYNGVLVEQSKGVEHR